MKTGLSIVELAKRIEANAAGKHDVIVPTDRLSLTANPENKSVTLFVPKDGDLAEGNYPIRPIAHNQIGAYTDIPSRYYDRMLAEEPELLASNVNTWFKKNPSKRMVRTLNGDARAFLSNRYQRIENEEIAQVALPVLLGDKDLTVVSSEVTERRLYIQATTKRVVGDVKVGDAVQAGVIISNSEVGQGSVSVRRVIFRLRCLNGLILPDNTYRANHTGSRIDDNEALWKDDTRQAEDKAILLKVRDMVMSAMDPKVFAANLATMQATTTQNIRGNPAKAIEVLGQKLGVTQDESGGILRALIEGGDLSRWGVINAVTAQAHTIESYDRSVEFEALGSKVIDLSPKDWSEVAEAA